MQAYRYPPLCGPAVQAVYAVPAGSVLVFVFIVHFMVISITVKTDDPRI